MAVCPGQHKTGRCGYTLYQCKNCGNVGCQSDKCSNRGFDQFQRCLRCGSDKKEQKR